MITLFEHIDNSYRSYHGVSVSRDQCRNHLQGAVKDKLLDREEREIQLEQLKTLLHETGFNNPSDQLLIDIQAIESETIDVQNFRIGEAYAEVILEEYFACRFHWNELRDARNPKGNKTGADLVGFIEVDNQVLFLFGEVKTSSEVKKRPPQVMTYKEGIEMQLKDLYANSVKRQVLILYLQNKVRHFSKKHPFKADFNASIKTYYTSNLYQLIGVLVRDVDPNVKDIEDNYHRLSKSILEPNGIKLLALYLPIRKEEWLTIINNRIGS